jgi:hypothetical protein
MGTRGVSVLELAWLKPAAQSATTIERTTKMWAIAVSSLFIVNLCLGNFCTDGLRGEFFQQLTAASHGQFNHVVDRPSLILCIFRLQQCMALSDHRPRRKAFRLGACDPFAHRSQ